MLQKQIRYWERCGFKKGERSLIAPWCLHKVLKALGFISSQRGQRLVRVLDPSYLKPLANVSDLSVIWIAYQFCLSREPFTLGLDLVEYSRDSSVRFLRFAGVAVSYICFPFRSGNCKGESFSQYKTLHWEKQEALIELNTRWTIMYLRCQWKVEDLGCTGI